MSERHDRMRRIRREKRRQRRQQRTPGKVIKMVFGWVVTVLAAVVIGYALVSFGFQKIYMVGTSMEPTLTDGEEYTLNRFVYLLGSPERYDIVAYQTVEEQDSYYIIKRVIGLPGETVLIENGQIYIDGELLSDCPITDEICTAGLAGNSITLDDGEYFLMGDNTKSSRDSRFYSVGNIKENEITGRIRVKTQEQSE